VHVDTNVFEKRLQPVTLNWLNQPTNHCGCGDK